MPTLGSTIADIRTDLNRDTTFDARIQTALINAIRFYRARRYGFNTKRKTILLTQEYTSLTANFIDIDYANIYPTGRIKNLVERDFIWLNEQHVTPSLSSEPRWFAVQDLQLRVYPPPDQTYSCEISYQYDLQDISFSTSDSGTTNAWFQDGYEVIKLHASIEVLEIYIGGPDAAQQAQQLRTREIEAEKELKRKGNRAQSSGQIRGRM